MWLCRCGYADEVTGLGILGIGSLPCFIHPDISLHTETVPLNPSPHKQHCAESPSFMTNVCCASL